MDTICTFIGMTTALIMNLFVFITCFDFKITPRWKIWLIIICYSIAATLLFKPLENTGNELLNFLTPFLIINLLPFLFLAKGSVAGKIYCFFFQYCVSFSLVLFASFIVQAFFAYDSNEYTIAYTTLTVVFYGINTFYMYKNGNSLYKTLFLYIKGAMWNAISTLPYLSLLAIKNLYFSRTPDVPMAVTGEARYILLPLVIIGGLIALTASILTVQRRIADQSELRLAQVLLSSGHEYYDKLSTMMENLQRQRHDHKFQMRTIQTLLDNGEINDSKRYLEALTAKLDETYIKEYCFSRVINALLSNYEDLSIKDNIDFFAQIEIDEHLDIDEYQLSVIIGNLLENALTACRKVPKEERRYIDIVMRRHDESFGIMVENSFNGEIKNDRLESTKLNINEPTGIGIHNIRAVAKRNDGEYIPNWDGKKFSAFVVLKLKERVKS